jgi:hypothetical protein
MEDLIPIEDPEPANKPTVEDHVIGVSKTPFYGGWRRFDREGTIHLLTANNTKKIF